MFKFNLSSSSKLTHLLSFLATAVVVFGILALYYPQILVNNLPGFLVNALTSNSWLPLTIFVFGLVLEVLAIAVDMLTQRKSQLAFTS